MRGFRGKVHKPFDCGSSFALAVRFEGFAQGDQRKYHRRRFKVEVVRKVMQMLGLYACLYHQRDTVYEGDCAAHRNKRVHIGRTVE